MQRSLDSKRTTSYKDSPGLPSGEDAKTPNTLRRTLRPEGLSSGTRKVLPHEARIYKSGLEETFLTRELA